MKAFEFASGVYWVGCVDYDHHDFHGYSKSPEGTTYNAYFIKDEKNTLIDTVAPGKAGTLLLKAAEAGLADAQCQAGRMYLEGDRLKQDSELGVYWLQQACRQSHPEALFLMSQIYGKGEAVAVQDRSSMNMKR